MKVGNSTKWPPRELLSYRTGLMSHFIRESPLVEDEAAAKKALRFGIKMLVFERFCGNTAVSIVAGFAYTHFRSLEI